MLYFLTSSITSFVFFRPDEILMEGNKTFDALQVLLGEVCFVLML